MQIVARNRYPDFVEAGIDVAIRTREYEADSGITVRKLAETRRVLAASPGYLASNLVAEVFFLVAQGFDLRLDTRDDISLKRCSFDLQHIYVRANRCQQHLRRHVGGCLPFLRLVRVPNPRRLPHPPHLSRLQRPLRRHPQRQ